MRTACFRATLLLCFVLAPVLLNADGGVVCLRQASGPFVVTVFSTPAELRAGPVDFSVMVQNRESRAALLDAAVDLKLKPRAAGGRAIEVAATRRQATNKLLKSAIVDLPAAGQWTLMVSVRRGAQKALFKTRLQVAPPLPRIAAIWPFLILPLLAVVVFTGHQFLCHRAVSRRSRSSTAKAAPL
jgi:hypothetical protein